MQRVMELHDPKGLEVKLDELVDEQVARKLDESGAIDRTSVVWSPVIAEAL